jgi:UDP-2,3-diacylglucosamine pyrophosphatase LpxH
MRLAIVSDAHLHDPTSRRQREFVEFLECIDADALVLLGDIFHAWGGLEGHGPDSVGPTLRAFEAVRDRGIPVTFVPGNHELRAGAVLRETLGWRVRGAHTEDVGGVPVHLAHGDEADVRLGYRVLRRGLRSRVFLGALDTAAPARAQQLLERLAGDGTATARRDPELVWLQRAWAHKRLAEGARAVVLGHSHIAGLVDTPDGLIVHTGAWAGLRTWIELDAHGVRLLRRVARQDEVLDARSWGSG